MSTSLSSRPGASGHPTRQQLDELDSLLQRMLELPVNQLEEPEPPAPRPRPSYTAPEPPPAVSYHTPLPEPAVEEESPLAPRVVDYRPEEHGGPAPPPVVARIKLPVTEGMSSTIDAAPLPTPEAPPTSPAPDGWPTPVEGWQPSAQTWAPLAATWEQARQAAARGTPPAPVPEPFAIPAAVPQTPPPVIPTGAAPVATPLAPSSPQSSPNLPELPHVWQTPLWVWPLKAFNWVFDLGAGMFGGPGRWLGTPAGRYLLAGVGFLCLAAAVGILVADWFGWTW